MFASVSLTGLLCRCWTAMLAFSLCLVRCKGGSLKTWQPWIYFFSIGLVCTCILENVTKNILISKELHSVFRLPVFLTGIKMCFVVLVQPANDTQPYLAYTQNQVLRMYPIYTVTLKICKLTGHNGTQSIHNHVVSPICVWMKISLSLIYYSNISLSTSHKQTQCSCE